MTALGALLVSGLFLLIPQALYADELNSVALEGARVGLDGPRTRIVIDLSGPATYRTFHLEAPERYVMDLEDVLGEVAVKKSEFLGTPIKALRSAPRDDSDYRVVLDLAEPGLVVKNFSLDPARGRGHRIVIDVYAPDALSPTYENNEGKSRVGLADPGSKSDEFEDRLPAASKTRSSKKAETGFAAVHQTAETESSHASAESYATGSEFISGMEWGGTWAQEYALTRDGSQKFEALVQPYVSADIGDNVRLTAVLRLRVDAVGDLGPDAARPDSYSKLNGPLLNNRHAEISLREFYFDFTTGDLDWRLGKQQIVWGQADGIKLLDVVNPQSFREFILDDFDDSRIPLWSAAVEMPVGDDGSLQWLWIPDTTYHELAEPGTPYFFTSKKLVPSGPENVPVDIRQPVKPNNPFMDGDYGLRYAGFVEGWDFSLNYLYHYQDFPVLYTAYEPFSGAVIEPEYRRNHLFGGTFSTSVSDVTLRGELAYNSDTYQVSSDLTSSLSVQTQELGGVIGADWQLSSSNLISAQWFYSRLLDYEDSIYRRQNEQILTFLWRSGWGNDSWQFSALGMYSMEDEDSLLQFKLRYWWLANLEIWLGADVFEGDLNGVFGQFRRADRLLFGFDYGF